MRRAPGACGVLRTRARCGEGSFALTHHPPVLIARRQKNTLRRSISRPPARLYCRAGLVADDRPQASLASGRGADGVPSSAQLECAVAEGVAMNTFLMTSQIVCYGLSIVSASVNIARFVRHRRCKAKRKVRTGLPIAPIAS